MKSIKKVYVVIIILVVLSIIGFCASYAFFSNINEEHGKLNIVVGDLAYKLESSDLVDYKITVPANTTKELMIELTSLNNIDSKYELYYKLDEKNNNVMVGYSNSTVDPVSGTIKANEKKTITLIIVNSSSTSSTVFISVTGGLVNNTLVLSTGSGLNNLIDQTTSFAKVLLASNELIAAKPTLTNSSNNTSDKSGLYASTDTNSGNPTYYFRGNVTNNYVKFAGLIWRIVRINEDGTIRMILQDGINNNTAYKFNSNNNNYTYMYYSNSEAKTTLESWYNTNIGNNSNYSKYVISGDYYCEQAKVKYNAGYVSGSAAMTVYTSYVPNFKCSNDGNVKGVVNANVGLLSYDEVVYAGGYPYQNNDNYYLANPSVYWWTMSSAGVNGTASIAWSIGTSGVFGIGSVNNSCGMRPVINLKANIQVSGTGTSSDPYVIIENLKESIMNNNTLITAKPTLTNSSNNTSDASGLYSSTDTNNGNPTYYFRGNVTNNYVKFAGLVWRIVRINEDGTIRIVMQDGINSNAGYVFNSNYNNYTYMYYSNSEAKTTLESWYNTNIGGNSDYSRYVIDGDYFCEQAKVKKYDSVTSGSADMVLPVNYTPDFRCSIDGNKKGIVNNNTGLLTYDEVVYAGGYFAQNNSSYYLYNNKYYWTMSPMGFNDSYARVWFVGSSIGDASVSMLTTSVTLRPVINLRLDVNASGTGTITDPYVVQS